MKYINTNKLEKLPINKENVYIAIDFDKTITAANSVDSWEASGKALGEDFKKESTKLYEFYAPIELDYKLSFKEKENYMIEWYSRCMDLYYKYKLTKEKIEKSIKSSNLIFRTGAKEIILKAHQKNIPIVILSAGIGNVIKQFLEENNCYYDNMYIISNFIKFNEITGNMKKFDNSKIIHTLNKTMKKHLPNEWEKIIKTKKYKILIGDLCEDENMIDKSMWNETLKIGILNKNIKENINVYKKTFDIVLTEENTDLRILNEIIKD